MIDYFDLLLSLLSNQIVQMITIVTAKMPSMPFPIMGSVCLRDSKFIVFSVLPPSGLSSNYFTSVRINPPAMTEAICPDTFTPMECINKKFWLSSCSPSL